MKSERQAIEMGIQLERDGREFYLKAAERTNDERGKTMFRSLAHDEAIHLRVLEQQLEAIQLSDHGRDLSEVEQASADWNTPLFPKSPDLFDKTVDPEASDLDALVFAIQIEHKSFELYREMANESEDPPAIEMFKWLAGAERSHFNQLMLNYESLINFGHWA